MLLTNGRIHTMDAAGSVVDSLVIREGRVAFAGRRGDVNPAAGEATLDLGGRAVLPGLVDGHGHLMLLARARLELDLAAARSEDEIARMVAAAAARRRPGEWITGRGWDQTRWPGQAFPIARLARSRGARASGRAHPRGRPCDVGQRRGARRAPASRATPRTRRAGASRRTSAASPPGS